jgi:hypothetical protein
MRSQARTGESKLPRLLVDLARDLVPHLMAVFTPALDAEDKLRLVRDLVAIAQVLEADPADHVRRAGTLARIGHGVALARRFPGNR